MIILSHPTTSAVTLDNATSFVVDEVTAVLVSAESVGDVAILWRLGPSGEYKVATNKEGTIYLSSIPNTIVIDTYGTYKVTKRVTELPVSIGYVNSSTIEPEPYHALIFSEETNSMYLPLI